MFSDSLKTLFYFKDKSLELYSERLPEGVLKWDFPSGLVENLEVKDQVSFADQLSSVVSEAGLGKQKALLVLSPEVLFTKIISPDEKNIAKSLEKFSDEIPFDPEKVAKIYFETDQGLALVATNKELYSVVVSALEKLGWSIPAVVPSLFWGDLGQTLDPDTIKQISQQTDLLKNYNFLAPPDFNSLLTKPEPEESKEVEKIAKTGENNSPEVKKGSTSKIIWRVTLIIALTLAGFGAVTLREEFTKSPAKKADLPVEVVSPTPTISPAPAVQISKEDLKVEVLNGTGIAGQAGEVKKIMEGLGFTTIEMGNAEEKVTEAVVIISNRVSEDIQAEVLGELEKTFTKVLTRTGETEVDILITTGKYIN